MSLGDTFIWSPDGRVRHLYVAVTKPTSDAGKFVVFNLTESSHGAHSFTLRPGDHPFIRKASAVNFGDGLIVTVSTYLAAVKAGTATPHQPMAMKIVEKIAVTAKTHPAVPGGVQKLVNLQW